MCGICGIILEDTSSPIERHLTLTMNRTMIHRGPDDEGYYFGRGVALAMRRLSIIDVEGGHQPMSSENGDVITVCNGELYNFKEIRGDLENRGHVFRTKSDVEVLPHLYEEYGAELPAKLNGMFGLAVWDEKERVLVLARDRMGEKPLYWTHQNGLFIFASELKAILAHPAVFVKVDRSSLSKYLAYEYVPAPHTIVQKVFKLEPGQVLIFKNGRVTTKPYWDVPVGVDNKLISEADAVSELLRLFELSVKRRLISDVPLGVFLSGGLDSSSVVAMMSKLKNSKDIKTFSIAFEEKSFDESGYAKKVAEYFGTDHREELCRPNDLIKLLPEVASLMDEPFGDASIVPTLALSKFTRKNVTVALGGDGGDEMFAGYPTFQAEKYYHYYRVLPKFLRKKIIEPLAGLLPASDENMSFDFKVKQFLKGACVDEPSRHIIWTGSFSPEEQKELFAFNPPIDTFSDLARHVQAGGLKFGGNAILYLYKKLYLAEDILTKVDRASMGASLESRAPFLDHELVEFVARLPYRMKLNGFTMKYLLKKAMGPMLPQGIAGRAKKGFGIPVAKWIKGPLKEMVQDHFGVNRIRQEGFFKPSTVTKLLKDHFDGRVDNRKKIWTLLMFEQWLERWA